MLFVYYYLSICTVARPLNQAVGSTTTTPFITNIRLARRWSSTLTADSRFEAARPSCHAAHAVVNGIDVLKHPALCKNPQLRVLSPEITLRTTNRIEPPLHHERCVDKNY